MLRKCPEPEIVGHFQSGEPTDDEASSSPHRSWACFFLIMFIIIYCFDARNSSVLAILIHQVDASCCWATVNDFARE
jgi:hypothetical protein